MTRLSGTFVRSLRPSRSAGGSKRMNTWQSIRSDVLERIRSREWEPGELIPTEEQLAKEMGCARATVNRALRELAESGIIERRRKVGTRVASTASRRTTLEMPVIRTEVEAMGATYGYRLTSFGMAEPTAAAARAMQLDGNQPLLLIKAQYLADDQPHCCEAIWLNTAVLPDITRADVEEMPPHEWLASNMPLTHGRFAILADGASGDCAVNLQVAEGTPVLTIERTNWSDTAAVSFSRQFYPPHHRLISEE